MSPAWNEFEALADLARREPIPAIDVADRVVASLLPQTRPRICEPASVDGTLWLASVLSLAAAVLVMAMASYQGVLAADPLTSLLQPIIPVIQ
jgi:hypothetical protein